MPTCIYCREEKQTSDFNAEHVFPVGLTGHRNKMPVLENTVCRLCNSRLGREVVEPFLRQSYEGVALRSYHGIIDVSKDDTLREIGMRINRHRVSAIVPSLSEQGIRYFFVGYPNDDPGFQPDEGHPRGFVQVPVQIGLLREGCPTPEYFIEAELLDSKCNLAGYFSTPEQPARVISPSEYGAEQAVAAARARGAIVDGYTVENPETGNTPGELNLSVSRAGLTRLVGNICLNFIAWKHGPEFALRRDFDVVRELVLDNGDGTNSPQIPYRFASWVEAKKVAEVPLFKTGSAAPQPTEHHVVVVDLGTDYKALVGLVTLFGQFTYRMTLTPNLEGLWTASMPRGTYFDWDKGEVCELAVLGRYAALL